jgi:hypothetical protein
MRRKRVLLRLWKKSPFSYAFDSIGTNHQIRFDSWTAIFKVDGIPVIRTGDDPFHTLRHYIPVWDPLAQAPP